MRFLIDTTHRRGRMPLRRLRNPHRTRTPEVEQSILTQRFGNYTSVGNTCLTTPKGLHPTAQGKRSATLGRRSTQTPNPERVLQNSRLKRTGQTCTTLSGLRIYPAGYPGWRGAARQLTLGYWVEPFQGSRGALSSGGGNAFWRSKNASLDTEIVRLASRCSQQDQPAECRRSQPRRGCWPAIFSVICHGSRRRRIGCAPSTRSTLHSRRYLDRRRGAPLRLRPGCRAQAHDGS